MNIADSLNPAELDMIYKAFGIELSEAYTPSLTEEIEWLCGLVTAEHIWDAMWRFGIVIDNDTPLMAESLAGYWNPTGSLRTRADYYVPSDHLEEVSVFNPPVSGASWDARPIA